MCFEIIIEIMMALVKNVLASTITLKNIFENCTLKCIAAHLRVKIQHLIHVQPCFTFGL